MSERFDFLVIGSGIAGLSYALKVAEQGTVAIVTKKERAESNTNYAQGGIAAVMDKTDSTEKHKQDTLIAGAGLCDPHIVEIVVTEGPTRVQELIDLGARFTKENGELHLGREGGHSENRIVHAADTTGREVERALLTSVAKHKNIQIFEHHFALELLTDHHTGRHVTRLSPDVTCYGAYVLDELTGKVETLLAKVTLLATGGSGQVYLHSTNPAIATGDGVAMAYRAKARIANMEFVQFHPTVLYIPGSTRHLISEAVRGEGAYLRDCHGKRFMSDYDSQEELAPRDVVSKSITHQMALTNHPCVYLDLSHIERERVQERFPHISRVCDDFGLDLAKDLIPVRPGAHYMIGGLTVNDIGQTTLPNLWAAGEATSTGLHGGNRLGSNSLLEGLVFGRHAGQGVSAAALKEEDRFAAPYLEAMPPAHHPEEDELNIVDLRNSLSSIMWRLVGIERNEEGLQEAQRQVEFWTRYVSHHVFDSPEGWELQNLMLAARLVIAAASERKESRGVHNRSDFPKTDPQQERHIRLLAKP